jgi:type IV secretion system protein VirB10
MSGTQGADPLATAKSPPKSWQYIFGFILTLAVLCLLWWGLRTTYRYNHQATAPTEQGDRSVAAPYQGPPDAKEKQAQRDREPPAPRPNPPPVIDESGAWNARTVWTPQNLQQPTPAPSAPADNGQPQGGADTAGGLLHGTTVAYNIPHPMFTVPEGKIISCNQITKIDTSSGGPILVSAIIDQDVWGIGNQMILMNKGTELIGEVGHGLVNGMDRLQVSWRRGRLPPPYNIRFTVDSPAAGPLGEGGLDGDINRHEWQKIKGVLLFTLLDLGSSIAQSALAARGTTSINLGNANFQGAGEQAGNILLQSQINIPDTITRNQGKKCSVFLAGDVDFSKVFGARIVK